MIDFTDLIGVPFVEFGRDAKKGLDCYGLAIEVARRYGKTLVDVPPRKFSVQQAENEAISRLNLIPSDNTQGECLVLEFRGLRDARLHIGITIDAQGTFLHATEAQGVRLSTLESSKGYLKFVRAYKII